MLIIVFKSILLIIYYILYLEKYAIREMPNKLYNI